MATGSPFPPVSWGSRSQVIGQANNVFIFPGVGLGLMASQAREATDGMFLEAARTLSQAATPERLAAGALYPPLRELRWVSRAIALRIASLANQGAGTGVEDPATAVDALIWYPDYQEY